MKTLFLLSLVVFVGCGKAPKQSSGYKSLISNVVNDSYFKPYVDLFENYSKGTVKVTTPIAFSKSLGKGQSAVCHREVNNNYILINEFYWQRIDENQRTTLIFHELGHCELNLEHDDLWFEANNEKGIGEFCPTTLMRTSSINEYESPRCIEGNEEYYYNELFTR